MNITRSGDSPSAAGPADYFTGQVRIDAPFKGSGALSGATVTFEPGARTAWHTHPLGQTIIITAGLGLVQRQGGPVEQVRRRHRLFRAGRKALARRILFLRDEPHRDCGGPGRQGGGLAGAGHGRRIRGGKSVTAANDTPRQETSVSAVVVIIGAGGIGVAIARWD